MDTDISDILASVSAPRLPQRTLDLQALTRAWINERTAPELLPWPAELVGRVTERIRQQIEVVEEMTGTMDPAANFKLVIIQTELERFKFLVRSLLRARMAKIDKYPHHTHQQHATSSSHAFQTLLSPLELQYLQHHQSLLSTHYQRAFLSAFPPTLQKLDDTTGGISMVDKPDEDAAVFVRVLRDAGTVEIQGEQGTGEVELRRGDVWVLRWRDVREGVGRGDVECI